MAINMKIAEIFVMREQLLANLLPSGEHAVLSALQVASCAADCITLTEAAKRLKGRNNCAVKLNEESRVLGISGGNDAWLPYRIIGLEMASFRQNHQN